MNPAPEEIQQITPEFLNSVLQPAIGAGQAVVIDVRQKRLGGPVNYNASLYRLF